MTSFTRKTLSVPVQFSGLGVHTGRAVDCSLLPAPSGQGILFHVRSEDPSLNYEVPATMASLELAERATKLVSPQDSAAHILTPEHLLSALYALGITDLTIVLTHYEVPIMDGSANIFVEEIQKVGVVDLNDAITPYCIEDPFFFTHEQSTLFLLPYDGFKITCAIEYPNTIIGTQVLALDISHERYISDIAMARTFGFRKDYNALLERGLAGGASEDNVLIIEEDDYFNQTRIERECVRHKCLDIIGDFSLLGRPFQGHVVAVKSGHKTHALCLKAHLELSA